MRGRRHSRDDRYRRAARHRPWKDNEMKPTISELDALLNSEDNRPVRITPDGKVVYYANDEAALDQSEAIALERRMIKSALLWDDCMVEFDGDLPTCGEHFQAMQDAIDKYRAALGVLGLPTKEPL